MRLTLSPWTFVAAAIVLEIAGTFLLKLSAGWAKPHWGALSIACYALCFWVLAPALKVLTVGVVYAIWSGVGIVAAAALGWLVFHERLFPVQLACGALILAGAVGLQLSSTR